MVSLVPAWVNLILSPLQQIVNSKIPAKLRPWTLVGVAAIFVFIFADEARLDPQLFFEQVGLLAGTVFTGYTLAKPLGGREITLGGARAVGAVLVLLVGVGWGSTLLAQTTAPDSLGAAEQAKEIARETGGLWLQYGLAQLGGILARLFKLR